MLKQVMCLAVGLAWVSPDVALAQTGGASSAGEKLQVDHIHIGVTDVPAALAWFERVFQWKPVFQNQRMAVLPVTPMGLILDQTDTNAAATLSFKSDDVDADYQRLIGRGAVSLEAPNDKPYGVRGAYVKGPGSLKIELEGPLKKPK